jgi:hypothetical protein
MNEITFTVFTTTSHWCIYAPNAYEAMRLALWFCWRDGEDFVKMQRTVGGRTITYRICAIDSDNTITTL